MGRKFRESLPNGLQRKLNEFLSQRKEFEQFRDLTHRYLRRAFLAGKSGEFEDYNAWRSEFEKEVREEGRLTEEAKLQKRLREEVRPLSARERRLLRVRNGTSSVQGAGEEEDVHS